LLFTTISYKTKGACRHELRGKRVISTLVINRTLHPRAAFLNLGARKTLLGFRKGFAGGNVSEACDYCEKQA
jgi:hypothetical protein